MLLAISVTTLIARLVCIILHNHTFSLKVSRVCSCKIIDGVKPPPPQLGDDLHD